MLSRGFVMSGKKREPHQLSMLLPISRSNRSKTDGTKRVSDVKTMISIPAEEQARRREILLNSLEQSGINRFLAQEKKKLR